MVGGSTDDPAITGGTLYTMFPMVAFIDSQYALKKWARIFSAPSLYVLKVTFNPAQTQIAAMIIDEVDTNTYIVSLTAANGALQNQF